MESSEAGEEAYSASSREFGPHVFPTGSRRKNGDLLRLMEGDRGGQLRI